MSFYGDKEDLIIPGQCTSDPIVFMDIKQGDRKLGRIVMELYSDVVLSLCAVSLLRLPRRRRTSVLFVLAKRVWATAARCSPTRDPSSTASSSLS